MLKSIHAIKGTFFKLLKLYMIILYTYDGGVAWIFQRGAPGFFKCGGGTVCHTKGTQYIRCTQYPWCDTLSCREYFDSKQISAVSFLTMVFGAKVLKILQIRTSSTSKYCMLSILEIKGLPKGGSRAPQVPTPSLRPCKRYLITLPTAVIVAVVFGNFIFSLFTK